MSHYTVAVITEDGKEDTVAIALAPYHEYECTGVDDKYVIWVDVHDEMIADHAKYEKDGAPFDEAWVEGWNGAKLRDGRYHRYTNPNAKWDWWQIGGRWSNMLNGKKDTAQKNELGELPDTFAYLIDGEWIERGRMGWWAIVSDEKSDDEWTASRAKIWEKIPDDAYITIVDCHI